MLRPLGAQVGERLALDIDRARVVPDTLFDVVQLLEQTLQHGVLAPPAEALEAVHRLLLLAAAARRFVKLNVAFSVARRTRSPAPGSRKSA